MGIFNSIKTINTIKVPETIMIVSGYILFKFYLSTGLALSPWKFVSLRLYFGLGPYLLDSVLLSKQVNTNINIDPIQ